MDYAQAALLGLLQGLTEFLPISSSAHLVLLPWALGWKYQGLAFDVPLHWGTLLALVICFWRQWRQLLLSWLKRDGTVNSRLFWGIVLGTIPAVIAGLALEDRVETVFHDPKPIALTLMAFGILLGLADLKAVQSKGLDGLNLKTCLLIGLAQAVALVPGVSRSGITITAALFLGLNREAAARFSFLLAVPVVLGAGLLEIAKIGPDIAAVPFGIGIATSAISGYLAIQFLLAYVRTKNLNVFVRT